VPNEPLKKNIEMLPKVLGNWDSPALMLARLALLHMIFLNHRYNYEMGHSLSFT
jgi:hypothetical protein